MAQVHIHPSLSRFSEDIQEIQISSETVESLLPALCTRFPKLQKTILNEQGELNPYVNLYINGENVNTQDPAKTLTTEDKVELITALVGG